MTTRRSLWPLFLISGAAVGYEIALTRYFAVAKWSEYGYWVISIVMAGFALSGVVRGARPRRGGAARAGAAAWLPVPLILSAAFGFWATTVNPFNPLQLQNAVTYRRSSPISRLLRRAAAVLLPDRALHQRQLRAERRPGRRWCTAMT